MKLTMGGDQDAWCEVGRKVGGLEGMSACKLESCLEEEKKLKERARDLEK
jgi:hypothetical protein